jgi:ribonuclease VapC
MASHGDCRRYLGHHRHLPAGAGCFGIRRCIGDDDEPVISAATLVETSLVLRGLKEIKPAEAESWLDEFIEAAGMRIDPVTPEQAMIARLAHTRFGKGTGHAAGLNDGDCFSYVNGS